MPDRDDALNAALRDFLAGYAAKAGDVPDGDWLLARLQLSLPEKGEDELKRICDTIITPLRRHGEAMRSLEAAKSQGRSRESWVAARLRKGGGRDGDGGCAVDAVARDISQSAGRAALEALMGGAGPSGGAFAPVAGAAEKLRSAPEGVKAAVAGALETAIERGNIPQLPKGTPAEEAADIAHIAVENVNILVLVGSGELSPEEGLERAGDVAAETAVSQMERVEAAKKGWELGSSLGGRVFGPVGKAVAGAVGAAIGYAAGPEISQNFKEGVRRLGDFARKYVLNPIREAAGWNAAKASVRVTAD